MLHSQWPEVGFSTKSQPGCLHALVWGMYFLMRPLSRIPQHPVRGRLILMYEPENATAA